MISQVSLGDGGGKNNKLVQVQRLLVLCLLHIDGINFVRSYFCLSLGFFNYNSTVNSVTFAAFKLF